MAAEGSGASETKHFNSSYSYEQRERWISIYPCYINSKKTLADGRRVPKNQAVENPTYVEMKEVCLKAGMTFGVENKVHPRERDPRDMKYIGRIRIQIKNEDGSPKMALFPTKKAVMAYIGQTLIRNRANSSGSSQTSQPQQGNKGKKKSGKKK